jgi:small subunit ribosomal protein S5
MAFKDVVEARRVPTPSGELADKTVFINRVAKVVKGGRRFSFSGLIVCGDGKGHIGYGLGKAVEVPDAIRKGSESARKNIVRVPLRGLTIPHEVHGRFGPTTVILKPGTPGTGVIAGSVLRAVAEVIGLKDIRTKIIGSSNPQYVVQAAIAGLLALKEPEIAAKARGKSIEELQYATY